MANIILPQAKVLDTISDNATMLVEQNGEIRRYNVTSLTEDFVSQVDNKPKAGFIYPLATPVVPEGFLLCDGAEYNRTEYSELFAAIGTIYGSGDGSTTFNVPNLATRVPVGKGSGYALGATGGESEHTLTLNEMPTHDHGSDSKNMMGDIGLQVSGDEGGGVGFGVEWAYLSPRTDLYIHVEPNGGSQAHNNMQPYTVVNYIIATGKDTGVSVQDVITGAQALPLGVEYGGTGATNAATARQNLGIKSIARNLLDNSDFTNPVNQRRSTKYMVSSDYTIDRWNAWHENGKTHVTIENGYLKIWAENTGGGSFSQRFVKGRLSENKNYTFAYKTNEGNIVIKNNPVVYGEVYDHVEITLSANETVNAEWAALYEGEYTAETLPEYQPKGYSAELAECLWYFEVLRPNTELYATSITENTGLYDMSVFFFQKRILPTITYTGNAIETMDMVDINSVRFRSKTKGCYVSTVTICADI